MSLVLLTFHFVDGFFIMNAFLIPPVHPFPPLRMLLWFFFGAVAYRECYKDVETWNTPARQFHPVEGRYRWLAAAVLITESLVAYKYREGTGHLTDDPTPWYIWYPWCAGLLSLAVFWLYLRLTPGLCTYKYPNFPEGKIVSPVSSPRRSVRLASPRKLKA